MECCNVLRSLNVLLILVVLSTDTVHTRATDAATDRSDPFIKYTALNDPRTSGDSNAIPIQYRLESLVGGGLSNDDETSLGGHGLENKRGWEQIDQYWRRPPKRAWELIDQLWERQHPKPWNGDSSLWGVGKRQKEKMFTMSLPSKRYILQKGPSEFVDKRRQRPIEELIEGKGQVDRLDSLMSPVILPADKQPSMYRANIERIMDNILETVLQNKSTNLDFFGTGAKDFFQPRTSDAAAEGNEPTFDFTNAFVSRQEKRGWDETGGFWHCHCCKRQYTSRCCKACKVLLTYTDDTDTRDFEMLRSMVCRCCKSALYKTDRCCALCNVLN